MTKEIKNLIDKNAKGVFNIINILIYFEHYWVLYQHRVVISGIFFNTLLFNLTLQTWLSLMPYQEVYTHSLECMVSSGLLDSLTFALASWLMKTLTCPFQNHILMLQGDHHLVYLQSWSGNDGRNQVAATRTFSCQCSNDCKNKTTGELR